MSWLKSVTWAPTSGLVPNMRFPVNVTAVPARAVAVSAAKFVIDVLIVPVPPTDGSGPAPPAGDATVVVVPAPELARVVVTGPAALGVVVVPDSAA